MAENLPLDLHFRPFGNEPFRGLFPSANVTEPPARKGKYTASKKPTAGKRNSMVVGKLEDEGGVKG